MEVGGWCEGGGDKKKREGSPSAGLRHVGILFLKSSWLACVLWSFGTAKNLWNPLGSRSHEK